MDAIEYVEMLATLDRQVAGLEDLLTRPELPDMTAKITMAALERWKAIRRIVARQNQPQPLIAPQVKALRKMVAGLNLGLEVAHDQVHIAQLAAAITSARQNFDEEVFTS